MARKGVACVALDHSTLSGPSPLSGQQSIITPPLSVGTDLDRTAADDLVVALGHSYN